MQRVLRYWRSAMLIRKIFVYAIDWFHLKYRINKRKVKLSNYEKIAVIGNGFNQRANDSLCGENLQIINSGNRNNIVIGDHVIADCKLNCNVHGHLSIGDYTLINKGTWINCIRGISIGKYCWIAANVVMKDYDGHPESVELRKKQAIEKTSKMRTNTYESKSDPIIIAENVFIGTGAMILKGVKIGYGSIIGAGSVVTRDIPEMSLAVGVPAKVVKTVPA